MNCDRTEELLIDYYYQELSSARQQEVADHLGSCSACAKAYCRLHADIAGVGQALEVRPRDRVRVSLRGRVAQEFAVTGWQRLGRLCAFPIPAYQTALALFVLLLIWTALGARLPLLQGSGGESAPVRATVLEDGFDASRIDPPDPNLL